MDERVRVKIKPLHNIGGVGKAGDVVWMSPADAEAYVRDGYVELVAFSGELLAVSDASTAPVSTPAPLPQGDDISEEDHVIMKPEVKRAAKKVVRKK